MEYTKYEQDMVAKIDAGERLEDHDLRELIFGYAISQSEHEQGRWTQYVETVVELCGRTFCIGWDRGLTEYQDNVYDRQPIEVKRHTYEKTITVTEWVPVKEVTNAN